MSILGFGDLIKIRALKGAFWTALHSLISLPLNILTNVIIARSLGVTEYSVFAGLIAAHSLILVLSNLGISETTVTLGTNAWTKGNSLELNKLLNGARSLHLLIIFPIVLCGSYWFLFRELNTLFFWFSIVTLISNFFSAEFLKLSCEARMSYMAKAGFVSNLLTQLLLIYTIPKLEDTMQIFVIKIAAGSLFSVALVLGLTWRSVFPIKFLFIHFIENYEVRKFLVRAFTISCLNAIISARITVVIANENLSGFEAGVYALAFGIAIQATALTDWIYAPILAPLSKYSERPYGDYWNMIGQILRVMLFWSSLTFVLVSVLCLPLVPYLYGDQFKNSIYLIPFLLNFLLIQTSARIVTSAFLAQRRNGDILVSSLISALVLLIMSLSLVEFLKSWGIILALQISAFTQLVFLLWKMQKQFLVKDSIVWRLVSYLIPYLFFCLLVYLEMISILSRAIFTFAALCLCIAFLFILLKSYIGSNSLREIWKTHKI